ncbi:pilus assembly PilX N-terminal domain-containing protein [Pseudidiomarina mangrovi]|uniref:pilus assembly PilX N-terminal domain-containing protein n=1 Tax=Pseudidiomarina mangrovi TaxID=2487133 RepID=UPI000FCA7742|nr:pilus assembly PilX N-terminal domain-containing protein [Pseudidiomarina mangrovi]
MRSKQTGFATLTLSVLLLAIIILVTLYTARFKMQEQRIMRNHLASQEAAMIAEAALEQVIMLINSDRTDLNRTITSTVAAASYTAVLVGTRYEDTPRGEIDVVDIRLTATSADGRATRTVQQQVAIMPLIRTEPDVPVAIRGSMNVSGSFQVVANPNGGGDGVPLSIWTSGDVDINGNGTTCGQQEFSEGNCATAPFSQRGDHGVDILDNDANFPADLLEYLFGVPEADWQQLRDMAVTEVANCDSLGPTSTGLIWVTGTCNLGAGDQIGSVENPVALIIQDADLTMNGGAEIFGIGFSFATPGNMTNYDFKMNGGAVINGAVMSNRDPDLSNGNLTVRYSGEVLSNLVTNDAFRRVYRIGGSWHDF